MKPLHVALVVKNKPAAYRREDRQMGQWSYPVNEFTWEHFSLGKNFQCDTRPFKRQGFDLLFLEDGGNYGDFTHRALPIVYYAIDSTLSEDHHYTPRFIQAQKSDLILVDHDRLERFEGIVPVRRWPYSINDRVFRDWCLPKEVDVAFHCNSGHAMPDHTRSVIRTQLHELCSEHGFIYASGMRGLEDYARALNRAKIVVNWARTPTNRPHRVYDALASRACLITSKLPEVSGETFVNGMELIEVKTPDTLMRVIPILLKSRDWEGIAERGYRWAMTQTWANRAKELRAILKQVFKI